jgi:dGTP triphosphohydrolase
MFPKRRIAMERVKEAFLSEKRVSEIVAEIKDNLEAVVTGPGYNKEENEKIALAAETALEEIELCLVVQFRAVADTLDEIAKDRADAVKKKEKSREDSEKASKKLEEKKDEEDIISACSRMHHSIYARS